MRRSTERVLTTHVGSLPRPSGLDDLLTAADRDMLGEGDQQGLAAKIRTAVGEVVARQAQAGIAVVSDGEMSKYGYATYVKERLSGFRGEDSALALSEFADYPTFAPRVTLEVSAPACTGPVESRGTAAVEVDIANLKAALEGAGVEEAFMNAASPGIICDYLDNQHYESEEAYLYALAEAMRPEYEAIADAGLLLQLDCPDLAMGRHLAAEPLGVDDFRRKMALRVEVINEALRDIPREQVRLHVCWGNYESPHHHDVPLAEIVDIVFRAKAGAFLIEAANPRHEHEWTVFEQVSLPDGAVLIPGVIDTLTNYIEHPELVAQRIVRYAGLVGRENVIAGTDCGFATFANFMNVHPDIAWGKLQALAEGAALATEQLWGTGAAATRANSAAV
jgi:5-methyltetrahydropteroyltriglutamate--homocysteine methyltransferase